MSAPKPAKPGVCRSGHAPPLTLQSEGESCELLQWRAHAGQPYLRVEVQTHCHPGGLAFHSLRLVLAKRHHMKMWPLKGRKGKLGRKSSVLTSAFWGFSPQLFKKKNRRKFSKTFLDLSRFFRLLVMLSAAIS